MLYILYCALGVLAWNGRAASSTPITYDQRQTGDVNVQIHLKDVQVVALLDSELLDDYTDYDYAYDYADFTIKPIVRPTTAGPPTSSVKPWNTWPTNPPKSSTTQISIASSSQSSSLNSVEPETTTKPTINHEALNESNSDSSKANSTIYSLGNLHENETDSQLRTKENSGDESLNADNIEKTENEEKHEAAGSPATIEGSAKKVCPAGYAMNKKGRCRTTQFRRRISLVPLTMRLGSKLSQKGRFTVRKDLPIRVYKSEPQQ